MTAQPLRSRNWFGRRDLDGFVHRSWLKTEGFSDLVFDGRPVVGIANSWSELTNCNAHLRQVAEAVKRGVWNGATLADNVREAKSYNDDVIRPLGVPLAAEGGTVVLSGNLCPDGAVLKQSAASPHLLTHRGRAVVFEDHADLHNRIDIPRCPSTSVPSSSSSTPARAGRRECLSGGRRQSPPGSCGKGCATWCASRTPG